MPGVKFRLHAGRSQHAAEETNRLLKAVSEIQLKFIRKCDVQSRFEQTLPVFRDVKDSQPGSMQFETVSLKGHVDRSKHLPAHCPWELTVTSFSLRLPMTSPLTL